MVARLVGEVEGDGDQQNAEAEVENIEGIVELGVNDVLEEGDDQDHQDHFGQAVFQIIERFDQ